MRTQLRIFAGLAVTAAVVAINLLPGPAHAASQWPTLPAAAGFGANTKGGNTGGVVMVTNLHDSGPGSLRAALVGNRHNIKFSVAGTIPLASQLLVRGQANITIDAVSAPAPGITLTGYGLTIRTSHDVIIQGLRVRNTTSGWDNLSVWDRSYNVLINRVSLSNCGDGCIDITEATHDVTVTNSLIGDTRPDSYLLHSKATLIANFNEGPVTNISLNRNAWVNLFQREPEVSTAGLVDIRNNLICDWGYYGQRLRAGATANIVNNYFATSALTHVKDAIILVPDTTPGDGLGAGPVFVDGNAGQAGVGTNALSTKSSPYPVAAVTTTDGGSVPAAVVAAAGAFPRDSDDATLISRINALP